MSFQYPVKTESLFLKTQSMWPDHCYCCCSVFFSFHLIKSVDDNYMLLSSSKPKEITALKSVCKNACKCPSQAGCVYNEDMTSFECVTKSVCKWSSQAGCVYNEDMTSFKCVSKNVCKWPSQAGCVYNEDITSFKCVSKSVCKWPSQAGCIYTDKCGWSCSVFCIQVS